MATSNEESKVRLSKFVETFLTCRHCTRRLRRPAILLCSHSFCRECLAALQQSDETVTCPVCQENLLLPRKGVNALKSNTFLEYLLKYITTLETFVSSDEPTGKCKLCESDGIKAYCQECAGAICNVCETQHERMKPFKGHTVVQLSDMVHGDIKETVRVLSHGEADEECPSHDGEPLRFFCQKCRTAVCRDCTVVDHNTSEHRVSALEEISDARRRDLGDVLKKLNEKRERNLKFIAGKEDTMKTILDQKSEISNAIDNITKELIDSINKQKKDLLEQLEKVTTSKIMGNKVIYEAAERDQKEMNDCCEITELVLATAKNVDLIQVNGEFYHCIKRQNSKLENYTFASQISQLGIVFKPRTVVDELKVGRIVPAQQHLDDRSSSGTSGWGGIEGSLKEFSSAFWNSLKE